MRKRKHVKVGASGRSHKRECREAREPKLV